MSFQFSEKENLSDMMDYLYKECGLENHYKNHNIRTVCIHLKILDLSSTAVKLPGQKVGRRVCIDTEDQWKWARTRLAGGIGELLVFIYAMGHMDRVEEKKARGTREETKTIIKLLRKKR